MKLTFTTSLIAGLLLSAPSFAMTAMELAAKYRAAGYDFVEVTTGLSQTKIEATKGATTLEVVIDQQSGAVLKQETEAADLEDIGRVGTEMRSRPRDFVETMGAPRPDSSDDDSLDDRDDDRDDDHDGHSGKGRGGDEDRDNDDDQSGSNDD